MYLLDTNVVSELRKAATRKAHPQVIAWAANIPVSQLFISAITLLELELGVLSIERRDGTQGRHLRNWLDNQVLPSFAQKILAIDSAVAVRCAALHVPNPVAERDALIAATALVHNMTIVTRNARDFEPTKASLINPWEI